MMTNTAQDVRTDGLLQLPGMAPVGGEVWRNRHTGQLGTVVRLIQRRKCWVIVRTDGRGVKLSLADWQNNWVRPGR